MAYELLTKPIEGFDATITSAYTLDGHYIGDEDWAKRLEELGIAPTIRTAQASVCSIGFCEREQKWYGWSHRAIFGFGIGSTVKPGDCAYTADTVDGLIDGYVTFFADVSDPEEVRARLKPDYENNRVWVGEKQVPVDAVVSTIDEAVEAIEDPGTRAGGSITFGGYWMNVGRGAWTAQTLDDAKQMASDFAESVS